MKRILGEEVFTIRSLWSLSLGVIFAFIGLNALISIIMAGSRYAFELPQSNDWEFYQHLLQTSAAPYLLAVSVAGVLAVIFYEMKRFTGNRRNH